MTSEDRTTRGKVPPPKTHYPPPEKEPRSAATQAAADRWLSGWPTTDPDRSQGGAHR